MSGLVDSPLHQQDGVVAKQGSTTYLTLPYLISQLCKPGHEETLEDGNKF